MIIRMKNYYIKYSITYLILAFISLIYSIVYAIEPVPRIRYTNTNDGLSSVFIKSIVEDDLGNVWLGSPNKGYNFFDGQNFGHWKDVSGKIPRFNNVTKSVKLKSGKIWTSFQNNGTIGILDPTLKKIQYIDSLFIADNNEVLQLKTINIADFCFNKSESVAWILTDKAQLYKVILDKDNVPISASKIMTPLKVNGKNFFASICFESQGDIWFAYNQNIFCYKSKSNTFVNIKNIDDKRLVKSLYEDKDGRLLITTNRGVYKVKNEKLIPLVSKQQHLLNNVDVSVIHQDEKGDFWLGTNKGLFHTKKLSEEAYFQNVTPEIEGKRFYTITSDSYGGIWFSVRLIGVGYINLYQTDFITLNGQEGKSKVSVFDIVKDNNKAIWMVIDVGLSIYDPSKKKYYYYPKTNEKCPIALHKNNIVSLFKNSNGEIWMCLKNHSFYKIEGNDYGNLTFRRMNIASKLRNIKGMVEGRKGVYWVVSENKKVIGRYSTWSNQFKYFDLPKLGKRVNNILYDKDDDILWLTTRKAGLHALHLDNNNEILRLQTFSQNKKDSTSIGSNNNYHLTQDKNGTIWAMGDNRILSKLVDKKKGIFQTFSKKSGLPNEFMKQMIFDKDNNMWLSGMNFYLYNTKTAALKRFDKETINNNMFIRDAMYEDENGYLYFGGVHGLSIIHPDFIKESPYSPTLYFDDLEIFGEKVSINKSFNGRVLLEKPLNDYKQITFNYNERDFRFILKGIYPPSNYKLNYHYKLVGYNDKWLTSTDGAIAFSLNTGDYKLNVYAEDEYGHTSDIKELKITVLAPWWEQLWFRISAVLLVMLLSYLFYRRKVALLKKNKKRLEALVKERTQEIAFQNEELKQLAEEITAQNNHIAEQNENMIASIQYARTIQTALLSSINTVISYFSGHFVFYQPKDIVSGDFYWAYQRDNKLYLAVVDCTGHGVPGALLSVIGVNILNKVVGELKIENPAEILENIDKEIKVLLSQEISRNDDGMDMSICVFEKNSKGTQLSFAGAKANVRIIRQGNLEAETVKGTRRSIGGWSSNTKRDFELNTIQLSSGDTVYLNTDGYIDQSNPEGRKLGTTRFVGLLEEVAQVPMTEQEQILYEKLESYKGSAPQRDDITVLGVRV